MKAKDNGPSFHPFTGFQTDASGAFCGQYFSEKGISLLDWFAGQALAGLIPSQTDSAASISEQGDNAELYAESAYKIARAMVAAREAQQ